jgi:hypothetical protein
LNHRGFDMGEFKFSSFKKDGLGIYSLVKKYQLKEEKKKVGRAKVHTSLG